jgi:4-amino-4-deoxy-L-arabinose transferase-like glycosyltransferase
MKQVTRTPSVLIWFGLGIGLIVFWLRLANLGAWPAFGDEATHVLWTQRFETGLPAYPFLMDGRFFLIVLASLFQLLGPAPLWIGRALVTLTSLIACFACMGLGRQLGGTRLGLIAGLIYGLSPFAVFYDRQFLSDSLMTHLGAAFLFVALRICYKRQLKLIIPFGGLFGLTVLAKFTGISYAIILVPSLMLLPATTIERRRVAGHYLLGLLLALVVIAVMLGIFSTRLGESTGAVADTSTSLLQCPPLFCTSLSQNLEKLATLGQGLVETMALYIGWPVIGLALLSWFVCDAPHALEARGLLGQRI